MSLRYGSLFSGYGGLELGVQSVLSGTTAWHCEIEPAPSKILAHHLPHVPNLGDITAADWDSVEPVDVLTGGFPCQDVSHAGKRLGLKPGTRSGLWSHMAYAIDKLRPGLVVAENVRGLLSAEAGGDLEPCPWCVGDGERGALRALGAVLGDLADLRYDAQWVGVRASDAGAPHGRFRVFVFAWPATDTRGEVVGLRSGLRTGQPSRQWRGRPDHSGVPDAVADANFTGLQGRGDRHALGAVAGGSAGIPSAVGRSAVAGRDPAADTDGDGQQGIGRVEPVGRDPHGRGGADITWGDYEPAIRRWEALTRPAPPPTEPGRSGAARLSPTFVEWLMGLPAGHVTDVPRLSRNDQLKALGNGVVPQQAAYATRIWLAARPSGSSSVQSCD